MFPKKGKKVTTITIQQLFGFIGNGNKCALGYLPLVNAHSAQEQIEGIFIV